MTHAAFVDFLETETKNLRDAGFLRHELELSTPQGAIVKAGEHELVNFASSDYLGLATHRELKKAAANAIDAWGVGVASSRMAVGTLTLHAELERALAKLLSVEDALVYASGHHADTGLFESLLGDRDYIFCDEMIRPSLADGIRLCRARVYSYRNDDMNHLEDRLKRSRAARFRFIATDGFFPATGKISNLNEIYALAEKYHATVVVDDTQAIGVLGAAGEGTHAALGLAGEADLVTGSFGGALGGGAGGFVAGKKSVIGWLRQKSRSHLSSTALAPAAVAVAMRALELLTGDETKGALATNMITFEAAMEKHAGLTIATKPATHPAVSVRVRTAVAAQRLTDYLFRKGYFVIGYCHPVVPEGEARIAVRVTARHETKALVDVAMAIGEGMKTLKIPL